MPRKAGSNKQVVPFVFGTLNYPNANGTLLAAAPLDVSAKEYVMTRRGSIIGMSGALSGALTTGTLTFQVTINGSLCPAFPDGGSLRTNQQRTYYVQDRDKANFTFVAGNRIGVHVAASDTINPTTAEVTVLIETLLDGIEY